MNRTTLRQATGPVSFVLVAFVCWFVAGMVADRMVQQELDAALHPQRQMSTSIVYNMAEVIASDLAMSRAIPATMAEMHVIQQALTQAADYAATGPDAESAHRDELLQDRRLPGGNLPARRQGFSGLDIIWLVNTNGLCVAASNAESEQSFIGLDMRARRYLTNALLGAFGEAYGVGRQSGEPGIFISAPVYDDGMLVGAVVAKVGIARCATGSRMPAPSSPTTTASSSWRTTANSKVTRCRTRASSR